MTTAFEHSRDALIMAIDTVNDVMRDHNRSAFNDPELIVSVMNVAGQVYAAHMIRDAIGNFLDRMEENNQPEAPPTAH